MEECDFTPGPWHVSNEGKLVIRDDEWLVPVAKAGYATNDEELATAKLIAAAPDLLEALQEMTAIVKKNSYPQPDKPSSNYARAEWAESIISKALGEE